MMSTVVNLHSIRGTLEQPILSESPCGLGTSHTMMAVLSLPPPLSFSFRWTSSLRLAPDTAPGE